MSELDWFVTVGELSTSVSADRESSKSICRHGE